MGEQDVAVQHLRAADELPARQRVRAGDDETHGEEHRRNRHGEAVGEEPLELGRLRDAVLRHVEEGQSGRLEEHLVAAETEADAVARNDKVADYPEERLDGRVGRPQPNPARRVQRRAGAREGSDGDPVQREQQERDDDRGTEGDAGGLQHGRGADAPLANAFESVLRVLDGLDGSHRSVPRVVGEFGRDVGDDAHASSTPSASCPFLTFSIMKTPMTATATSMMAAPSPYFWKRNASR